MVENICRASCPQLVFRASLTHLIDSRHLIFTDASRGESGDYVGVGIYSPTLHIREMLRVDHNSSVFSDEYIAIIRAMECVLENGVGKVTIFSDSRIVIDIVSSSRIDRDFNYLVLVLKSKLRSTFLQGLDVILTRIPAHAGILGNESADLLAKRTVREGEPSEYLPPHTDFYSLSRERYIKIAGDFLAAQAGRKGSQYFDLYPSFSANAWFSGLSLDCTGIITAARIHSNHYNLNYSLHRCNIVDSPACDALRQDISHFYHPLVLSGSLRVPRTLT